MVNVWRVYSVHIPRKCGTFFVCFRIRKKSSSNMNYKNKNKFNCRRIPVEHFTVTLHESLWNTVRLHEFLGNTVRLHESIPIWNTVRLHESLWNTVRLLKNKKDRMETGQIFRRFMQTAEPFTLLDIMDMEPRILVGLIQDIIDMEPIEFLLA